MAEQEAAAVATPRKSSKKAILFGVLIMVVAGAGGFYAAWSGRVPGRHSGDGADHAAVEEPADSPLPDIAFVPIEPVVVTLGPAGDRHLRFAAQLEVPKEHQHEVELILPRVSDVLNTYLRAIDIAEFEKPEALIRLRAQILRRIKLVAGEGRVRDLLVSEYVIN